ncbi:MAG: TPM domain-containing protein [Ruminococcaceae bacterium]|nr:TPM domain-containing protein [Oscillospiraceae bacterium]
MKKIFSLVLTVILASLLCIGTFARSDMPLLVDEADVLNSFEEEMLLETLEDVSDEHDMDIVVLTVESLDGEWPEDYADDYYDYNDYSSDGVLLLICPESGDGHISTSGYGITSITDAALETIFEEISPLLSDGDYAEAFETFALQCDEYITMAEDGDPFDYEDLPKEPFNVFKSIVLSLIVGLVIAFVVTLIMKGNLKSVHFNDSASEYVKKGSMNVTQSRDLFLYTRVTRTPKPKDNGGSRTHTSSSGRSHGGGSFKF